MEHSEPGTISVDSELVTHTTGALPLRTDRKFTAVLDENNNPLVFSVGEDSKCYAIKVQADGRRRLIDIGSRLGISQPVHAFSVSQSADGSLYITFASRKDDNSTTENLHVLAPFSPKELNDAEVDLKPYLLQNKSTPRTGTDFPTDISFENIYLGPAIPPDYPLLIAAYKRPNGQTDISRVTVDLTGKTWTWKTDLDLPENAATVIDMAPGHSRLGPGLFYVYRIREEVTMLFMGTDMEANQGRVFRRKAVNFPKDAKCIAAFNDSQGNSHVLVGANGLWHYSPSALLSNRAPTLLSSDPMYDLLENLVVARANDSISVWFENQSKTLGYQQGVLDGAKCTLHDEPVPLRPEGTCAEFAPLLDPKSYSQSLVVSDLKGQMTILEQAPDSRLWKETPFHVPSTDNNIEYLAYMTHIEIADAEGNRLPMLKTRITSSDWVTVVVNGQTLSIGKTGTDVLTDSQGVLTLIVPTDDISTFSFTLTTPGSGIISEDQPFEIDPSVKVKTKLGSIENGESLSKARLPDGSLLLEGSDASSEDLDSAAKTIKELHGMLPASGGADAPVSQPASSRAASEDKPIRGVWDFFEWVGRKAKEAWEWTVSKVKDAWHFVVKLGKQVWNFILDTAARVKKAITFVFQKIGVAFKKLAEWIGYIFNWGDIKKTQQSIVTVVKGVMGRGVSFLEAEEEKVEATFKRLKEMAASSPIDPKVSSHKYDPKEKKSSAVTVSAPANSSAYHYEHGGVKEALQNQGNPHSERGLDKIWSEDILPALTNIGKTISAAISDLLSIVGNSQGLTVEQILKKAVGDMIVSLLDAVKAIVISVLRLGKLLITTLGKALDYDLTGIPFFGPLLRKLNGGYKLTMLDIVALILAIPTTIISKIIIGRPPTQITEDDFKADETGLSDKVTRSISELGSSLQISWYIFAAVRDTIRIYTAEVGDLVPSSPGNFSLVCDLVINICTYPPRSIGPDSAYEYRRAAWLVLTLNSVIKAIVWKVPAFPGKAKATVFSDAITGSIAFWLLQVVHSKEINEEFGDKDEVSTGLRIGKSVSDFIKNVAIVAGVLAIDPATKTIAVVASTGAGAAAQALESSVVSRDHEKKYYPFD